MEGFGFWSTWWGGPVWRQSFPYFYPPMTSKMCHILHSNLLIASLMKTIVSGEKVDLRKLAPVVLKTFYTLETLEYSQCGCVQLWKSQKREFNSEAPSLNQKPKSLGAELAWVPKLSGDVQGLMGCRRIRLHPGSWRERSSEWFKKNVIKVEDLKALHYGLVRYELLSLCGENWKESFKNQNERWCIR